MKTDEFSDAIRQKLDSVSPPFQEKKWVQFQQFMYQAGFPPSVWQSPRQWWQPALSAATVAGLVVASVWQYQANKALNQHVQTLTQSIDRLEKAQTSLQRSVIELSQVPARPDTIYVVQQRDHYGTASLTYAVKPPRLAPQLAQTDNRNANRTESVRAVDQPQSLPGDAPVVGYRPQPDRQLARQSAGQDSQAHRPAIRDPVPKPVSPAETRLATDRRTGQPIVPGSIDKLNDQPNSLNVSPAYDNTRYVHSPTKTVPKNNVNTLQIDTYAAAEVASQPVVQPIPQAVPQVIEPINPVGITLNTEALETSWASRLRRVRYRSPYTPTVVTTAAPANRPTPSAIEWRLGIGGDIGTEQSALSVNTEAVIGHWAISAGIGQAIWRGDAFQTEAQFTQKTRRDFRNQYPNDTPFPPTAAVPRPAVDIIRSGRALLIPLQVGYRLAVGKQVRLTPFVGLNLSLNASETIHFDYERPLLRPPRDPDDVRQRLNVSRPLDWYSSWTVGFSAERQWGHFVGQLSPLAAVPLTVSGPSLNTASVGLRARLYYQF